MRVLLTPSRSSAFLIYVSPTNFRISFLIVRSPRTLGVFVAISPWCAVVTLMIPDTAV